VKGQLLLRTIDHHLFAISLAKERVRCTHIADSDEPSANLMPDPCPNCELYYVNDDNSVEQPRADSSPAGNSTTTTRIEGASHRDGLGLSRSR
jgi:hypothetical protein